MFPLCVWVLMLSLQCGGFCNAIHTVQTMNLQVKYGESAILPCDCSAYLEEEMSVHWEAMGDDVAILQGGELRQGDKFKDRVLLPSEEKIREGDWTVVLQNTILSDTDMYECIWQGRRTISTVWLTVLEPQVERSLVVPAGDAVLLTCYIQISRGQSLNDMQAWWTRNSSTIVSSVKEFSSPVVSSSEDITRIQILPHTKDAFHLHMSPTIMRDNGEYSCLYKTRDSDDPRPGIPESITLTVLESIPEDPDFHPEETTIGTDNWVSTSHFYTTPWTDEVTETTDSPYDLFPVFLEDSTQLIKVMTDSKPMEAVEETLTSFPDEGSQETESVHWDTLPWIRIGLISGVLLVTAVVLCILGALRKI